MIVGVMGPEGSYSEKAAKSWILKYGMSGVRTPVFCRYRGCISGGGPGKIRHLDNTDRKLY